jgi:RES domain-containing protein
LILHGSRIVKEKHAATAFTGKGAKRFGGRWNNPGMAVVYIAGSASLAMLEMLVHIEAPELLKRYALFKVSFDDRLVTTVDIKNLPKTWRKSPPPRAVQIIGDEWIVGRKSAVLRVPSVVVPTEWNYLLNPAHAEFGAITIGTKQRIKFDPRLIKT